MNKANKPERIFWAVMAALWLSMVLFVPALANANAAEETPRFVYAQYDAGKGVRGYADIPDGFRRCYVAAMFWTDERNHVDVLMQINEDGSFSCKEKAEGEYVELWIVDNDFVFTAGGPFHIWDQWKVEWGKPPDGNM